MCDFIASRVPRVRASQVVASHTQRMQLTATIVLLLSIIATTFALRSRPFGAAIVGKASSSKTAMAAAASFYDIVEVGSKGESVPFEQYRGKVVYGVNVATKCGYTASGYALLEKISAMKDKGVEILILPCNQFGGQEPGSEAEIESFCALKGVKGATVFKKADVNGPATRPVYQYMKDKGVLGDVAWNFAGKFIVDKNGNAMPVKSEKTLEADLLRLAESA